MSQNQTPIKHLYRSTANRVIFGVCGGLGEYFRIDPVIIRMIFLALTFGGGLGILLYLVLAFLTPKAPPDLTPVSGVAPESIDVKQRVDEMASELKRSGFSGMAGKWLGVIIVLSGLLLLLDQVFPIHLFRSGFFWGIVIIILGIFIITRNKKTGGRDRTSSDRNIPVQPPPAPEAYSEKEVIREIHHHHHHDRRGGIGWLFFGLLIVVIGFGFLAQNLGYISGIDFEFLVKFWPVFIIMAGLSVLSRGTRVGTVLAILFALAIIALMVYSFFNNTGNMAEMQKYNIDIGDSVNKAIAFEQ